MKRYKVRELSLHKLEYGSGSASCPYDGVTRYVRITDIDEEGNLGTDIVSPNTVDEKYVLSDGDILFARSGATVGKTYRYRSSDGRCIYAGYLIRVVPNQSVICPDYLYYFTKSPRYRRFVQSSMRVVAQPNINAKQYGELELAVPALKEQHQIIVKLQKLYHAIALRRKELQLFDDLIKARFVEMFGDETNPYNWPVINVEEVANVSVGVVIKPAQYYTDAEYGVKAFRSLNIGPMAIKDGDWVYFSHEGNDKNAKSQLKENDLLIVRSGAPGTACVVPKQYEGCNAIDIIIARPNTERVNPYYLCTYTNMPHGKRQIEEGTGGAAQQHFNVGKYNKLRLMLPPIKFQNEFVNFVAKVDKSKVAVQKSLDETQKLFDSLMQKYFG